MRFPGFQPVKVKPYLLRLRESGKIRPPLDEGLFPVASVLCIEKTVKMNAIFHRLQAQTIKAKACDAVRGMLPAASLSNVGIYGTGQAYEALLLRMRAHPLPEVRRYAQMMLEELRVVIPSFLKRVDREDRGGAWSAYIEERRERTADMTAHLLDGEEPEPRPSVTLVDFDPEGEDKVLAAILYSASDLPEDQLAARVRALAPEERFALLDAYVGERGNRRHKPGRAFERTGYRFDVLADYGAFRDLQRHRMLTIEWQPLSTLHGYEVPEAIDEAGLRDQFDGAMARSACACANASRYFLATFGQVISRACR